MRRRRDLARKSRRESPVDHVYDPLACLEVPGRDRRGLDRIDYRPLGCRDDDGAVEAVVQGELGREQSLD